MFQLLQIAVNERHNFEEDGQQFVDSHYLFIIIKVYYCITTQSFMITSLQFKTFKTTLITKLSPFVVYFHDFCLYGTRHYFNNNKK